MIILSVGVGSSGWVSISFTALILFLLYIKYYQYYASAWRMVKRLKWFYLSIFLVYLLFNQETSTYQSSLFVYFSGLITGGLRVAILLLIVLSVNLLIRSSSKEELLSGLYLLIRPLKWIGICPQNFILRAYLTLDYMHTLDHQLSGQKDFFKQSLPFKKIVPRLAEFIADWVEQAQVKSSRYFEIHLLNFPILWEWIIPISLVLLYIYFPSQITRIL